MSNRDRQQDQARQEATYWLVKMQSPSFTESDEKCFFEWLSASASNQKAYLHAEQTWERGGVLSEVKVTKSSKHGFFDFGGLNAFGWQSAVLASFLCVALFFGFKGYNDSPPKFVEYKTQLGEQREVALQDGSTMVLNTDSLARVSFQKTRRIVLLDKGEVFFSVKRDAKRPFDVRTFSGSIRVLGTQFSVYNSATDTTVTVLEGKVGLAAAVPLDGDPVDGDPFSADQVLTANQQMRLEDLDKGVDAKSVDAAAHIAWRTKRIVAIDKPLGVVVSDINRYYKTEIRINDPLLADKKVSVVIALGDFDLTLRTLTTSLSLQTQPDASNDTVVLY